MSGRLLLNRYWWLFGLIPAICCSPRSGHAIHFCPGCQAGQRRGQGNFSGCWTPFCHLSVWAAALQSWSLPQTNERQHDSSALGTEWRTKTAVVSRDERRVQALWVAVALATISRGGEGTNIQIIKQFIDNFVIKGVWQCFFFIYMYITCL